MSGDPWLRRILPFLLIAALGVLFFAKLVFHPSWVLYTDFSDLLSYHVPQARFLVSSRQQTGELPLWCPYSFAGMPFIHDIQVQAFYPPHLVLYVLPEETVGTALSWLIAAHVIVAGWTMFAYARSQGLNQTCATVAALGYMFSGKWLLHLLAAGQYIAIGLAWVPLVLLLLERSLGRGGFVVATWAGAVLALVILGSHPQFTFFAGILIVLWTLPPALEQAGVLARGGGSLRKTVLGLGRWFGAFAWCSLVALALSAVQIIPALEAAGLTSRAALGMRFNIETDFFFNILGLVGPAPESLPVVGWENRTGLTVLWMATALLAPVLARGQARLGLQTAICLGLVIFGLGGAFIFQSLPGFRLFRLPSRMFLLVPLPVALLVGMTTQALFDLLRTAPTAGRTMRWSLVLVPLVGIGSAAILCYWGGQPWGVPLFLYWGSLLVTLPIACWVLWSAGSANHRSPRWTAPHFELAWGTLLVVDLWAMAWPLVEVRPLSSIYAPSSCVQFLMKQRTAQGRVLDRESPDHGECTPFVPALPILNRLEPLRGYNPLDIHRYKEFIQFISDRDEPLQPRNGIRNFPLVNKSLIDFLGARYLLQPSDFARMAGESSDITGDCRWQKVAEDRAPERHLFIARGVRQFPPYSVYENREAYPRAFVVPRAESLPRRSHVLAALKKADLRQVVFLEDLDPQSGTPHPLGRFQPASIAAYQPNHVVIDVEIDSPGYLVLSDPWYPGWTCTLDGRPTRLYRANYAFRSVAVPAGKHQIRLAFQPMSYRCGSMISSGSLAAILGLGLVTVVRYYRRRLRGWQRSNRVESEQTGGEAAE